MRPVGYVVLQRAVRLDRPVSAHGRWMASIPGVYAAAVLDEAALAGRTIDTDPGCLTALDPFAILRPRAEEARKPMFALKPADGALGGHVSAVAGCRRDYRRLARVVAQRAGLPCAVGRRVKRPRSRRAPFPKGGPSWPGPSGPSGGRGAEVLYFRGVQPTGFRGIGGTYPVAEERSDMRERRVGLGVQNRG